MGNQNFRQMLKTQWSRENFVCIGLDSDLEKIPESISRCGIYSAIVEFNYVIVESTKDIAGAYKLNTAFYEANGIEGIKALQQTIVDIHNIAPDVPVILDAKRADIGNTNMGSVEFAFDYLKADAVTVNPYFGAEALQPFLARKEKGVIVLCRTSNPGASEFQDLRVSIPTEELRYLQSVQATPWTYGLTAHNTTLYNHVAYQVSQAWNSNNNCSVVVGATYPGELRAVRRIVGDMPILIPGIGAQGGDLEKVVAAGKDSRGQGIIVNSSRGIIFASKDVDYAEAARRETEKLRNLINQYR